MLPVPTSKRQVPLPPHIRAFIPPETLPRDDDGDDDDDDGDDGHDGADADGHGHDDDDDDDDGYDDELR